MLQMFPPKGGPPSNSRLKSTPASLPPGFKRAFICRTYASRKVRIERTEKCLLQDQVKLTYADQKNRR